MTTTKATYRILVDLNGDRDFEDANEDISAYRKFVTWSLGAADPLDYVARAATSTLVLDNQDELFSPDSGSALSGFEPGAIVAYESVYDGGTIRHFIGEISRITPTPGEYLERECVVEVDGWLAQLNDEEVFIAVQEDKTYDEIVTEIIESSGASPPGAEGWYLGIPPLSKLGETTILGDPTDASMILETGTTVYEIVGDNWEKGVSIRKALDQVALMETGGLFLCLHVNRDGKMVGYDRHYPWTDQTSATDGTIDGNDIIDGEYLYGEDLLNSVTVAYNLRTVGDAVEVLAQPSDEYIKVGAGETKTVTLKYTSDEGVKIGGKDIVTPVASTDFTAWSIARFGVGTELTSSISMSVTEGSTSSKLEITNGATRPAHIFNLQLRGTKITDYGRSEAFSEDTDSVSTYNRRQKTIRMPVVNNATFAQDIADYIVYTSKDPRGDFRELDLWANKSTDLMEFVLNRTVGDRIDVSEGQTGLSNTEYFIVGEVHTVDESRLHEVTYILRAAPTDPVWILGETDFSELGNDTYLGV